MHARVKLFLNAIFMIIQPLIAISYEKVDTFNNSYFMFDDGSEILFDIFSIFTNCYLLFLSLIFRKNDFALIPNRANMRFLQLSGVLNLLLAFKTIENSKKYAFLRIVRKQLCIFLISIFKEGTLVTRRLFKSRTMYHHTFHLSVH